MFSPREASQYIKLERVSFGQDVTLPDDVDLRNCEEFFGTRCPNNIHVTGHRRAHVDRVDPRKNPLGHIKKDMGIPITLITTSAGASIGALVSKNNRKTGALVGGLFGLVVGLIADLALD